MKYLALGLGGLLVLILLSVGLFYMYGTRTFDSSVKYQEQVDQAWGDVQSNYQRRADLIQNLVNTVKGAADFEQETLTKVIEARANATSINVDADNLTPENFKAFEKAQSGLSSALSRLLVTVERYPELKATQAFRDLQVQLEGTENRINVARERYNEAVMNYNSHIRGFWKSKALAWVSDEDFSKREMFEAQEGADVAPVVDFEK